MKTNWKLKEPFGPFSKLLITLFIISLVFVLGIFVWFKTSLEAPSHDSKKISFVIKKGETTASFAERLQEKGLIKNALAFRLYLKFSSIDKKIQAGSFVLTANVNAEKLAKTLTTGRQDSWLTVREGLRKEEVADLLTKEFGLDKEEFLNKAKEGYLFPDTYLFPVRLSVDSALAIFEKNYSSKFTDDLVAQAAKQNLTKEEALNLASIVERESKDSQERPIIAGILLNRLAIGMRIEADATVQYALGYSQEEKTWWKKTLTQEDLQLDSPYNTRKYGGLPPGPISSPGLSSLKAVANPQETEYFYYLHDSEGKAHFAKTYQEHLQNVQTFLR